MKTYKELLEKFEELNEGVYDRGIFKAIFIAGGSGSGKSFVTHHTTSGLGLKLINSDDAFERGLAKANIGFDIKSMTADEYENAMVIRNRAKEITNLKQSLAIKGRLGLVIDGTGKDFGKIKKQSDALRALGYETFMIFVNTSIETSLERNAMRTRKVPEDIVKNSWTRVQNNMGKFQNYFGLSNFVLVDNNNATENILTKVYKRIANIVDKPIQSYIAKNWIEKEMELKRR